MQLLAAIGGAASAAGMVPTAAGFSALAQHLLLVIESAAGALEEGDPYGALEQLRTVIPSPPLTHQLAGATAAPPPVSPPQDD